MALTFQGYSEVNSAGDRKSGRPGKGKSGHGSSGPRPHRKGTAAEARAMFGQYSRGATPDQ